MGFVDEEQVILRHVVQQRRRRLTWQAAAEVARIIFDAVAIADRAHHLHIEHSALHNALGFNEFALLFQFFFPPVEFVLDADDGPVALVGLHDVVRFRVDGNAPDVFLAGADFAGQRIDLTNFVDLITPHFNAIAVVFVRRINFENVPANAKGAAAEVFAAFVLNIHESPQHGFARSLVALFEHDQHSEIGFRRADAVDAGDAGDDDDVLAFEQRAGGAHPQLVELVVDGGFFFNVDVGGGNVGLGLIKIVIADEIFYGVFGEEALELVIKLRGEGFIVRQDERRAIGLFDDLGHGKSFSGAGDAEKNLVLVAGLEAAEELVDGRGLIATGLIVAAQLKVHRMVLLRVFRAQWKLSLYRESQIFVGSGFQGAGAAVGWGTKIVSRWLVASTL